MFYSVRKKIFSVLLLVSMSVVQGSAASVPLTDTQLHAVLGIVTGFILSDVDSDGDGVLDSQDAFPHDANESVDTDGDGIGNNADTDDDGDGISDGDEVAAGSDPLDANSIASNGVVYKVVTSPYTGHKWLDRNLGASQVCTAYNDVNCYGDYFQWGRDADGHEDKNSGITDVQATSFIPGHANFITGHADWVTDTSFDGKYPIFRANLWSKRDGSSVCPVGFRVPTINELKAETLDNGVTNRDTAFTSFLKLPSAGYRDLLDGALYEVGNTGYIYTSTVKNSSEPLEIYFNSGDADLSSDGSFAYGDSVRCVKPIVITDMPPIITLHTPANVEMIQFGNFPGIKVTAVDDVDGILFPFRVGSVNTSVAGTYTLTYTATDSSGHTSNPVIVTVTVHPAMKKTGQTVIYDKDGNTHTHAQADSNVSLRDDGYYQKGHDPLYVRDDGDETVTDNITGLMWQDDAAVADAGNKKQWLTDANYNDCRDNGNNCENTSGDTAASYCAALSLGGHEDWRLPTADELVGITDKGKTNPVIDNAFQNAVSNDYWSSTTNANNSNSTWYVNFNFGNQSYDYKGGSGYVRCVRAGQ